MRQNHLRWRTRPWRLFSVVSLLALFLANLLFVIPSGVEAKGQPTPGLYTGQLGGSFFKIEIPPNWNGTLVLYSHGYVVPGTPITQSSAPDAGDPLTAGVLLKEGYALAGGSYSTTGWALEQAIPEQKALLDYFSKTFAHPSRTIAWGHSLGGIITAGLIQRYPNSFDGALPMCGVLAGGVGTWNQALDATFVFKTLLSDSKPLQIVNITNPSGNLQLGEQLLAAATATPQGLARLALVAAVADTPGWFDPTTPRPSDFNQQLANQIKWMSQVNFPFVLAFRAELEARAGGNPSWNVGVDYEDQLERSIDREEVKALYKAAGLSLDKDLETLNHAPRVKADPKAVAYLAKNITFTGEIDMPVLTMHTTGDGLVNVEQEQIYGKQVREADNGRLLRQIYVSRAGHCTFSPAETLTAFHTLVNRLNTGHWGSTSAAVLNKEAQGLGPGLNIISAGGNIVPAGPSFIPYKPAPFLRPFTRGDDGGGHHGGED